MELTRVCTEDLGDGGNSALEMVQPFWGTEKAEANGLQDRAEEKRRNQILVLLWHGISDQQRALSVIGCLRNQADQTRFKQYRQNKRGFVVMCS